MAESSINPTCINCGYHNVLVYISRYFSTPTRSPGLSPDDVNNFPSKSWLAPPCRYPKILNCFGGYLREFDLLNIWTSGQNAVALSVLFDHSFPHALIFGWSSASHALRVITRNLQTPHPLQNLPTPTILCPRSEFVGPGINGTPRNYRVLGFRWQSRTLIFHSTPKTFSIEKDFHSIFK